MVREHDQHRAETTQRAPVPAAAFEAEDESEQIQRQRQHPEQRNRRDVLGHVVGDREQQQRARCQREPQDLPRCRRRSLAVMRFACGAPIASAAARPSSRTCRCGGSLPAAMHNPTNRAYPPDHHSAWCGSPPRAPSAPDNRQRQHRREVRQRKQPVRTHSRPRACEPRLEHGTGRRKQQVRKAERAEEQPENPQRRILVADGLPFHAGEIAGRPATAAAASVRNPTCRAA